MLQIAICDDNRADGQMMKTLLSENPVAVIYFRTEKHWNMK